MMERDIELRQVVEEDLSTFYEQQLDPVATEMAAFPSRAWEPFVTHWRKIMADEAGTLRTILFEGKVAGNIVGFVQDGEREVGYWIGREYWGRGIATEALRQFLEELKTRPLYAHVVMHNVASRRVLEKCGFKMAREEADEFVLIKGE
ncbi:MAG: GNAT family N-acetyltransferase [Anaerolineales bacterium]